MGWKLRAAVFAGLALAATSPAGAQSVANEQARERPGRDLEATRGIADAATEAREDAALAGPDVTWAQVLEAPDDLGLNLAYARTRLREGDVDAAAATLERLLMRHPEAAELRLFLVAILTRGGDTATARIHLAQIDDARLTAPQRRERDALVERVGRAERALRQTLTLSLGGRMDTNRNAAPSSETILIQDLPFTLEGSGRKTRDYAFAAQAIHDLVYDLRIAPRTELYATTSLFLEDQARLSRYDSFGVGVEAGVRRRLGDWTLALGPYVSWMALDQQNYMNAAGLAFHPSYRFDRNWEGFADLRIGRQGLRPIESDPVADDNSGTVAAAWIGALWRGLPGHTVSAALGQTRRDARESYAASDRTALRISDSWSLGGGFLIASGEAGLTRHDAPNPVFSEITRLDRDLRLGITYGVPLGRIAEGLPDEAAGLVLSASAEYARQVSNFTNNTTTNLRTGMMLTKQWGF